MLIFIRAKRDIIDQHWFKLAHDIQLCFSTCFSVFFFFHLSLRCSHCVANVEFRKNSLWWCFMFTIRAYDIDLCRTRVQDRRNGVVYWPRLLWCYNIAARCVWEFLWGIPLLDYCRRREIIDYEGIRSNSFIFRQIKMFISTLWTITRMVKLMLNCLYVSS